MGTTPRRALLFLTATVSLASMALGFPPLEIDEWAVPHSEGTRLSAARPECPQTWDSVPLYGVAKVHQGKESMTFARSSDGINGVIAGSGAKANLGTGPSLSGPITDIPEFHDCQKLIDASGTKYGDLTAIFSASKLDSIGARVTFDRVYYASSNAAVATVDQSGRVTAVANGIDTVTVRSSVDLQLTAIVTVTVIAGGGTAPDPTVRPGTPANVQIGVGNSFHIRTAPGPTKTTLPFAEIYTYGEGYKPLGIGPNFNCLYVYVDNDLALRAKMVHAPYLGSKWDACRDAVDPLKARGETLTVLRTTGGRFDDYPAASRWDWDAVSHQQYIGIKCGAAWCEIGRPTGGRIHLSPVHDPGTGFPSREQRVLRIKGWYDEQVLAYADGPGHAIPTSLRGTVIPDPGLDTANDAVFKKTPRPWIPVAYVALAPDVDPINGITAVGKPASEINGLATAYYKKKFNFDTVRVRASLQALNQVSLCYGTRTMCGVPPLPGGPKGCPSTRNMFGVTKDRWWSKIVSAVKHDVVFKCITRRDHSGMALRVPAAARWRWLADDETVWEDCTQGCCEVWSRL
jgi:hypothetical protein